MRTLRLTLAYDGTNYVGWQRQINGVSIQQVVEDAFAPLVSDPSRRSTITGAGRTDAGVHAEGQVASVNVDFDLEPLAVRRALNVRLPYDIRVLDVEDAPLGFHAQFNARSKSYRYRMVTTQVLSPFDRWFVWHAPGRKDLDAMRAAAASFVGRHDFVSFQASGSATVDTVRTLEKVAITERDGEIVFDVEGDGFLRHMVRAIVGTLAQVGAGSRAAASAAEMIAARDRRAAGLTAPASGLTLVHVKY